MQVQAQTSSQAPLYPQVFVGAPKLQVSFSASLLTDGIILPELLYSPSHYSSSYPQKALQVQSLHQRPNSSCDEKFPDVSEKIHT
jgi:hypothetical protein